MRNVAVGLLLLSSILYVTCACAVGFGEMLSDKAIKDNKQVQIEAKGLNLALIRCEKKHSQDVDSNMMCQLQVIESHANQGNYIAQVMMGNFSIVKNNKEEAIKWLQASIDNPRSPEVFKDNVKVQLAKLGHPHL